MRRAASAAALAIVGLGLVDSSLEATDQAPVGERSDVIGVLGAAGAANPVLVLLGQRIGFIEAGAVDEQEGEVPDRLEGLGVVHGEQFTSGGQGGAK